MTGTDMPREKNADEIFCQSCGERIKAAAVICVHCGTAVRGNSTLDKTSLTARSSPRYEIAVFVLGLLSLLICAPLGIIGWLLSIKGTRQIREGDATRSGAFTAGKIMCIVGTSICILLGIGAIIWGAFRVRPYASAISNTSMRTEETTASKPGTHSITGFWFAESVTYGDRTSARWIWRIDELRNGSVSIGMSVCPGQPPPISVLQERTFNYDGIKKIQWDRSQLAFECFDVAISVNLINDSMFTGTIRNMQNQQVGNYSLRKLQP
jgi:hypothetical protein